jgi:Secretion system C-terminal sorting domain
MKKIVITFIAFAFICKAAWGQEYCIAPKIISHVGNNYVFELYLVSGATPFNLDVYSGILNVVNGTVTAATITTDPGSGTGGGSFTASSITFSILDPANVPAITVGATIATGFLMGTVTINSATMPLITIDGGVTEIQKVGMMLPLPQTAGCAIVLPTDLLSFKGIKKGAVSQLQWEATNEKNLINYIVERSADGRNFHPIGFNKPKAVSSLEKATYDFIDDQPEIGLNYYRLLSKGFGKDEKYSKVISLDFGIGLSGRAFPNPLDGDLTIELDIENGSGEVVVGIYDVAGRQVVSKKIQNSDRRLNIPLPTADLPPGSYLVRVKAGVFSWERQITKM